MFSRFSFITKKKKRFRFNQFNIIFLLKTQVRWADKKGGHGEHYWDYNHAGHHDDGEVRIH